MRPPVQDIPAPPFPPRAPWINVATLRMDKQRGRPVLIEFWDFCRVNSLRTLPYLKAWHERYEPHGLRVVGAHCGGFPPSRDEDEVRAAVERLGITYPVLIDSEFELWGLFGIGGWPSRYLFGPDGMLSEFHVGEGGYRETELAIQELVGEEREPLPPQRPEDDPDARLVPQSEDQEGAYSGPYEAGGVWAVLEGAGTISVNGEQRAIAHSGCHALIEHERHTTAVLELDIGDGVTCHAVCFTPGIAP